MRAAENKKITSFFAANLFRGTEAREDRETGAVYPFFEKRVVFLPTRSLVFNALRLFFVFTDGIIRPIRGVQAQCTEVARTDRKVLSSLSLECSAIKKKSKSFYRKLLCKNVSFVISISNCKTYKLLLNGIEIAAADNNCRLFTVIFYTRDLYICNSLMHTVFLCKELSSPENNFISHDRPGYFISTVQLLFVPFETSYIVQY